MKKIFLLSLVFLVSCSIFVGSRHNIGAAKFQCNAFSACPDFNEVDRFFAEEKIIWETECGIRDFDEAIKNIHGRLEIHFSEDLAEEVGALGRYWPREHIIEVQYPHPKWLGILRHELGLAIAQTQLGYVGEAKKIEWYQCHPKL